MNPALVDQVVASYESGLSVRLVSDRYWIPFHKVRKCLQVAGVEFRAPNGSAHEAHARYFRERNARIAELYRTGLTLQQVGDLQEPKITRERVRQIVWKVEHRKDYDVKRRRH